MSDTSWAEAAAQMIAVVTRLASLQGELNAWAAGTATGGPNDDGRYPFTQPDQTVALILSPAKLATLTQLSQADRDLLTLTNAVARGALVEAERKGTTYRQEGAPEVPVFRDLWGDLTAGGALKFWDGEQWLGIGGGGGGGGGGAKATAVRTLENGPLVGSAEFVWQTAVEYLIEIGDPAKAFVTADMVQSYTSVQQLPLLWSCRMLIDGELIHDMTGNLFGNENPSLSVIKSIDAGTRTIALQWRAIKPSLRLMQAALTTIIL